MGEHAIVVRSAGGGGKVRAKDYGITETCVNDKLCVYLGLFACGFGTQLLFIYQV